MIVSNERYNIFLRNTAFQNHEMIKRAKEIDFPAQTTRNFSHFIFWQTIWPSHQIERTQCIRHCVCQHKNLSIFRLLLLSNYICVNKSVKKRFEFLWTFLSWQCCANRGWRFFLSKTKRTIFFSQGGLRSAFLLFLAVHQFTPRLGYLSQAPKCMICSLS